MRVKPWKRARSCNVFFSSRRRHTRCYRDWSSDVCSSDLVAGLDDTMFSDTLFGHKKGAYTGADEGREGLIARAAGGTLFLDEIGDTNESSQVKLLRLLQEQTD